MSLRTRFHKLLVIVMLVLSLLAGAPMQPEEIEELMHQVNQPKVAHTLRQEKEEADELP